MDMHVTSDFISNVNTIYDVSESTGDQQYPLTQDHTEVIPRGETTPKLSYANGNLALCTIDVTNVHWIDCFNTSVNYYVYLHKNPQQKPPGFYFLQVNYLTGHMALSECYSSPAGPLWIQSTMKLYIMFYVEQYDALMKLEAKRAYDNYNQDCCINRKYGRTYESHI